jgi:pimeloyl-ACP methyl ester carboxylesterase
MAPVRSFSFAGATLVAERRGSGNPAFVLLHGIGMGRSVFGDLVAHLDDSAQVIAIDLPGYGEAPEPERVLTMERTADLIAAFVRASVRERVVVVGHSMGAQIGIEIAARQPDVIDRLVLIGPSGDPDARTSSAQLSRLLRDIADESPKVIAAGAREYVRAGPKLTTKFRAMLVHRPEDVLSKVAVPTLVIRGENDLVAPRAWCRAIVEGIPSARLVEVPGRGHEAMIRDAAPAAAAISEFVGEA